MEEHTIELNQKRNDQCSRCSAAERSQCLEDDLCRVATSVEDGLPVRCVGRWAYEKIYRLVQYFGIFVQGMKNKWAGKLNYIEICSGPGRCVLREIGEELDGTALAIARHPHFSLLHNAVFVDYNPRTLEVLSKRLSNTHAVGTKIYTIQGDFTDQGNLLRILGALPSRHLNLVFIDPTECNLPFRTIELIASTLQSVDLIINIALGTDANRNLVSAFVDPKFAKAKQKYTEFLGGPTFFENAENRQKAQFNNNEALRELFLSEYTERLRQLGFVHTDMKAVRNYYSLLFASRHAKGLEFWRKANKIDPYGQRSLFY